MKAAGLIVEYNPFHNGHKLHLQKSIQLTDADVSIAVMSGNFLQRGEPAVINKWKRAEMALNNGVDLVVELPSYYSNQSAEIFAEGAVMILEYLNVDNVVFGSESGDITKLTEIAKIQLGNEFGEKIKNRMQQGISYPNAMDKVLEEITGEKNLLSPNNILGLEYIKAGLKKDYKIGFETVKREKVGFYSEKIVENISSATNIRKYIVKNDLENIKKAVPIESFDIIKSEIEGLRTISLEDYYELIKYKILSDKINIANIQDVEVGFENRLYDACIKSKSFDVFFKNLLTKRYTNARVKRVLSHILLDMDKEFIENMRKKPAYIRVLAFNRKGREYMSKIKKDMKVPLITTFKNITADFDEKQRKVMEYEMMTDNIYKIKNYYDEPKRPVVKEL